MEYTDSDIRRQVTTSPHSEVAISLPVDASRGVPTGCAAHDQHRQPAAAGELRLGAALASQRFLEPGDVPVAVELAALFRVQRHALEPESLVQLDRLRVGQGDAGIRAMQVFALERFEQRLVEPRTRAPADRVGSEIDARLD